MAINRHSRPHPKKHPGTHPPHAPEHPQVARIRDHFCAEARELTQDKPNGKPAARRRRQMERANAK